MTELQRIAVKILTDAPPSLNLDPFLAIFGRWRTATAHPADWVDLADYAHMPRGPGIVLVGKRCNFSFDLGGAAPGLLYASKMGLEGAPEARLLSVFRACLEMSRSLLAEAEFPASVRLQTGSLELIFNDRLETANTEATDQQLKPAVVAALDRLLGPGAYQLTPQADPDRRYGFFIRAARPLNLDEMLSRFQD